MSVVLRASLQQWRDSMYALAERSQGHEFVARVGPLCPDHGISFVFVAWLAKTCVNPLQRLVAVDSLSFNTRLISNCAGEYSRPDIGVFLYAKRAKCISRPSSDAFLVNALLFQLISGFAHRMGPCEDLMS